MIYFIRKNRLLVFIFALFTFFFPLQLSSNNTSEGLFRIGKETNPFSLSTPRTGFMPYYLPPIFQGKFYFNVFDRNQLKPLLDSGRSFLIPEKKLPDSFKTDSTVKALRNKAYRNYFKKHLQDVKYTQAYIDSIPPVKQVPPPSVFRRIFNAKPNEDLGSIDIIEPYRAKISHWNWEANSLIQFSQNYISDNWYKGGTGNLNLISEQEFKLNYKKDKISFNNEIKWRFSFYTNPSDTTIDIKIGDDLIRTYHDFGIQAFDSKWSYSTNLEIKTQAFRNIKNNPEEISTAPFSPIYITMGILGMKYNLEKNHPDNKYKKLRVTADISPLSAQYIYVADKDIDPTKFGIKEGEKYSLILGSTINTKFSYQVNREVKFASRLKFFTNYKQLLIESENELNMQWSRFFSTRLYLYGRFDDAPGVIKDPNLGYLQLNELISFGFNYSW